MSAFVRSTLLTGGSLVAWLLNTSFVVQAQSVQVSGTLSTYPSPNPKSNWETPLIAPGRSGLDVGSNSAGQAGIGSMSLTAGGRVVSGNGKIGAVVGSTGTVTVSGADGDGKASQWTLEPLNTGYGGRLWVGDAGTGMLIIENGGKVASNIGEIGLSPTGIGTVAVTGTGSQWTNDLDLYVGNSGKGTLTISAGGSVSNNAAFVASGNYLASRTMSGKVVVTDAGSTWSNNGNVAIGQRGAGSLTIAKGGKVSVGTGGTETIFLASGGVGTGTGALNIGAAAEDAAAAAGVLEASRIQIGDKGTLNLKHTDSAYVLGVKLSGRGAVEQRAGTTILINDNSGFTGTTTISGGMLKIGNGDTGARLRGNIVNNAELAFDQADDWTFAGQISGEGEAFKRGTGKLTLGGGSTSVWKVEQGMLVTAAGRFGGDAAIENGASLVFDQLADAAYGGALSGAGGFEKIGAGATLLTGDSSDFSGLTTLSAGMLIVGDSADDALGGSLTARTGTTLAGIGALGGATASVIELEAGAVHAPGISAAATSQIVSGDYINSGTLRIDGSPSGMDKLIVTGEVDITGARLDLVLTPLVETGWSIVNGPFTLIDKQSAGLARGEFDEVLSNLLFLDPTLNYTGGDGNDIALKLTRNNVNFADLGKTRNQIASAGAVDTLPNNNPIWNAVALSTSESELRFLLDRLSGEIHASLKAVLISDSRFLRQAVVNRLRAVREERGAVMVAASGDTVIEPAVDREVARRRSGFWMSGFGSWGDWNADDNAATLDRSSGGTFAGVDTTVGDWRIGLMGGYSRANIDVDDRTSSAASDGYHVGVYAGTEWRNIALRAGASYSWNDIDTSRSVPGQDLKADYGAGATQIFAELAYVAELGGLILEPFVNAAYVDLHAEGFNESGGNAALQSKSTDTDSFVTTLGIRPEARLDIGETTVRLGGLIGWRHTFGDITPQSRFAFDGSADFIIRGVPMARDAVIVEAGLDLLVTEGVTFGAAYQGQFGGGNTDNGFNARLGIEF